MLREAVLSPWCGSMPDSVFREGSCPINMWLIWFYRCRCLAQHRPQRFCASQQSFPFSQVLLFPRSSRELPGTKTFVDKTTVPAQQLSPRTVSRTPTTKYPATTKESSRLLSHTRRTLRSGWRRERLPSLQNTRFQLPGRKKQQDWIRDGSDTNVLGDARFRQANAPCRVVDDRTHHCRETRDAGSATVLTPPSTSTPVHSSRRDARS